jgi:Tol biopolymer transport system component
MRIIMTTLALLSCLAGFSQTTRPRLIDSGAMPQVFAPDVLSTPYSEWSVSFSPDGNTAYSSMGDIYWTIVVAHRANGVWQQPKVASFSGRFRDTDPFVTPDGSKLFFISSRPFLPNAPANVPQKVTHVWYAGRKGGDWDIPQHLDSAINLTNVANYAPSVSAKGTLYYCSRRKELNGMQSFYTEWQGDHYTQPKQVVIKGANEIQDPFIAPDESYLVYLDGNDICISFREKDGWSAAQKLGPEVNNGNGNSSPHVSADGKTLYYTSERIQGFYKRDLTKPALNYDELVKENNSLFNNKGNILMIPIHLPPNN